MREIFYYRAKQIDLEYMSADDLKKVGVFLFDFIRSSTPTKKFVKKLAKKYDAFPASGTLIKQIPHLRSLQYRVIRYFILSYILLVCDL